MKKLYRCISMIILLVLFAGIMTGCGKSDNSSTNSVLAVSAEPTVTVQPTLSVNEDGSDKVEYFLLIGADNNYGTSMDVTGNSDGLVIVSLNLTDHTITLTSILRDTVLSVADYPNETNKATLIYHYYGLDCLIRSIEDTMGITFKNYLLFNYLDIIDLVDSVGGIDTEVYPEEIEVANAKLRALNRDMLYVDEEDGLFTEDSGTVHMTGKQAVVYMRVRLSDETNNDFGRTERQRRVILLLKDKFLSMSSFKQISFVKKVIGMIETDFSVIDAVNYAKQMDEFKTYDIKTNHIPQDGTYNGSNGYIHMNSAKNRIYFFNQVYGDNGGMPSELKKELSALQADLDSGNAEQYYK